MKVVLFCGGLGTRLREYSATIPKPMVNIGQHPILWHLMRYYAHYGHTEFVCCLGYRGHVIQQYFWNGDAAPAGEVAPLDGGATRRASRCAFGSWRITFVDTGLGASVGQRLKAVEPYLEGDDVFLANYADGLSDLPLPRYLRYFRRHDKIAGLVCVRPPHSFHAVDLADDGLVRTVRPASDTGLWINGGFFVFKRSIFRYIEEGDDLVDAPFGRLMAEQQLVAYRHEGFWRCMDTFKDKQFFDDLNARGTRPWQVWTAAPEPPRAREPGTAEVTLRRATGSGEPADHGC